MTTIFIESCSHQQALMVLRKEVEGCIQLQSSRTPTKIKYHRKKSVCASGGIPFKRLNTIRKEHRDPSTCNGGDLNVHAPAPPPFQAAIDLGLVPTITMTKFQHLMYNLPHQLSSNAFIPSRYCMWDHTSERMRETIQGYRYEAMLRRY